jgi:hypothetical protein
MGILGKLNEIMGPGSAFYKLVANDPGRFAFFAAALAILLFWLLTAGSHGRYQ